MILNFFGKNIENHINFFVSIVKDIKVIDKKAKKKSGKSKKDKLKYIESFQFLSTYLENLADELSDGIQKKRRCTCKSSINYLKEEEESTTYFCSKRQKYKVSNW